MLQMFLYTCVLGAEAVCWLRSVWFYWAAAVCPVLLAARATGDIMKCSWNAAHGKWSCANQRARFLPAASPGNRGPLFPKIRKTQGATQPLPISDIWHMCSDCLALQRSFPCDCFLLQFKVGAFETVLLLGPPFPPSGDKKKEGILTFPRISAVHHQCFWRQLEAFLMETFTHPGKLPRPQDSAKPLMMIESASAPRWKHAESQTLECAARLALGLEGGRREREDLDGSVH